MKYIFLLALLISNGAVSCIVGPVQLDLNEKYGFKIKVSDSEFCKTCSEIDVVAPAEYEGRLFGGGVFTVFMNGNIVSKSMHSYKNQAGTPEFLGYVSNLPGFSYSVSFRYGEGRCKAYEFTSTNNVKNS